MNTYTITEKQNANSRRDGTTIIAKDLAGAKRKATKNQAFYGTVLEIKNDHGTVLAIKENKAWENK